ncbi:MAG: transposase [Bacteroidetes bacterium]|nr:transposase [Bacteroidota bacterium]MBS1737227.1 transposase [Bacteroidota bacterium]
MKEELTLLLIFLSSWKEDTTDEESIHHAWKGYDFELLDTLKEKGFIDFFYKAKSVSISEEGCNWLNSFLKNIRMCN